MKPDFHTKIVLTVIALALILVGCVDTPKNCAGGAFTLTDDDKLRVRSIGQDLLPILQYTKSNPPGGSIPFELITKIQAAGGSQGLADKAKFWLEHTPSSDGDLCTALIALQQRFQTAANMTK